MSTNTQTLSSVGALAGSASAPGLLQRIWHRLMEGQQRKATVFLDQYLAGLPNHELTRLGYGPIAIKALRKRATGIGTSWI